MAEKKEKRGVPGGVPGRGSFWGAKREGAEKRAPTVPGPSKKKTPGPRPPTGGARKPPGEVYEAPPGGPTVASSGGYTEWDDPETGEHHRVYIPPSGGGLPVYTEGTRKDQVLGQEDIPMATVPGGGIVGPGYHPSGAPEMTADEAQQIQEWQSMAEMGGRRGKPPEGYQVPDYGPQGRESFENTLFEQIGINPFTYNIHEEIEKATQEALPQLFEMAFGGRLYYRDVDKLDKEESAYWQQALKGFRAHVYQHLKAKYESAMNEYNWSMNKWDTVAKEKKAIEERQLKERGIEAKAAEAGKMTDAQGATLVKRTYDVEKGGQIIADPGRVKEYNLAMKRFWELRNQGIDPGRAATAAVKFSDDALNQYWTYHRGTKGDKKKIEALDKAFKEQYGFIPQFAPRI